LLSNNPALSIFLVLFLIGAVLFVAGSLIAQADRRRAQSPAHVSSAALTWTHAVAGTKDALGDDTRLDLIDRLAIIGEPWCVDALREAVAQEENPAIRNAAERALSSR
jgi:hypothetical protein